MEKTQQQAEQEVRDTIAENAAGMATGYDQADRELAHKAHDVYVAECKKLDPNFPDQRFPASEPDALKFWLTVARNIKAL